LYQIEKTLLMNKRRTSHAMSTELRPNCHNLFMESTSWEPLFKDRAMKENASSDLRQEENASIKITEKVHPWTVGDNLER